MTVKELKEILKDCNDNDLVVLQKDAEGNGYSPLDGADDNSVYIPDSTWSGEVRYKKLTAQMRKAGYTKEDTAKVGEDGAVACVVLWPVN